MSQQVDAVYTNGMLKPAHELPLRDKQRVRLTVEAIDDVPAGDREAAIARLRAGIASMGFFSEGRLPTREELHERR
jgi:predicted DNA-binding antitoxin AbrB/MazE fold protein